MKKYVIVTDSCSDLHQQLREQYDVEYIPMHTVGNGREFPSSLDWEYISNEDFYNAMREGTRFTTSQINEQEYTEYFEKRINEGYDILSISCSSALSNSVKGSYAVRDKLLAKYPDAKILCVDSLNSGFGLGNQCIVASVMRKQGKTIEETYKWLQQNKLCSHQIATVDNLNYLRRAGRVSATSAVFGGILDIKPIIISDAIGQNFANEKVRGRKSAIRRLVTLFQEHYRTTPYQLVFISHADCLQDALDLQARIREVLPDKDVEIRVEKMGPIIAGSAGPGTLQIYFWGDKVTVNEQLAE